MSIHHISRTRKATIAVFVSASILSTAIADSTTGSTDRAQSAHEPRQPVAVCRTIDRPKHTIRNCPCTPGALSGVGSIDAAEILRLLTRESGCPGPVVPRR